MADLENGNKPEYSATSGTSLLYGALLGAVFLPSLSTPNSLAKLFETFIGFVCMVLVLVPAGFIADIASLYSDNPSSWPRKGLPYTAKFLIWAVALDAFLALLLLGAWSFKVSRDTTQHWLGLTEPGILMSILLSNLIGGLIGPSVAFLFKLSYQLSRGTKG